MLKEAIELLLNTGRDNARAKASSFPGEPPHVYHVVKPDGTIDRCEATPHPAAHSLLSLESLTDVANDLSGEAAAKASIWYSREGVILIFDSETRRDRATFALTLSRQLQALAEWEHKGGAVYRQKEAILALRTNFRDCVPESLVAVLRRVKFVVNQAGQATVEHGKTSMGKQIEAEITGTSAIPEYVSFEVPPFHNHAAPRVAVPCAVEPDAEAQTFRFIPLPGSVEQAIRAAEAELEARLKELLDETFHDRRIYHGKP